MRPKYSTSNFVPLVIKRTFLRLASVSAHFDSSSSHYPHTSSVRQSGTHLYCSITRGCHDARSVCSEDIRNVPGSLSYPRIANLEVRMSHMNRSIEPKTNPSPTQLLL